MKKLPPFFSVDPRAYLYKMWLPIFDTLLLRYCQAGGDGKTIGLLTGQARGSLVAILSEIKNPKLSGEVAVLKKFLLATTRFSEHDKNPVAGWNKTIAFKVANATQLSIDVKFGVAYFEMNDLEHVDPWPSTPWKSVEKGFAAIEKEVTTQGTAKEVFAGLEKYFGKGNIYVGKR